MVTGLANWHYPHRTLIENIEYFAANGFEAQALLGSQFLEELRAGGETKGDAIRRTGVEQPIRNTMENYVDHVLEKVPDEPLDMWAVARVLRDTCFDGGLTIERRPAFSSPAMVKRQMTVSCTR